jgi:uncharacterized membrane protein YccC
MTKIGAGNRSGFQSGHRTTAVLRRTARRFELRSFGLVPEHFNHVEGYRAAVTVAVPLAVAVSTGHAELGWAVFAAFWTCLCDVQGPDRLRRRILAIFVVCGALVALIGSWFASFAPAAGMVFGPLLVVLAVLGASRIAYGGLLGTLLAVVAVVAVGFPHPLEKAVLQAAAFFVGSAWAYLLINFLWRIDPMLPLHRARDAVVVRLLDMTESLVTLGERPHRDERWHSEYAEHRRAVRLSIERLCRLLDRYIGKAGATGPFLHARDAAETMFSALIALDQSFIDRMGSVGERLAVARTYRMALLAWHLASRAGTSGNKTVKWAANRARRLRSRLTEDVFVGCALALENALDELLKPVAAPVFENPPVAGDGKRTRGIPVAVLQQALRQSAGLIAVYYAAIIFQLGYPYWAAMAVVVVLQGGARVTWARCLERILGSLLGGVIALALLHLVSASAPLSILAIALAAAAIALRSVNYTIFVVFLTMLFIIVTEILQPGVGIASARMLDNVIGSIAALLAVFLLWPDFGASLTEEIRQGIAANRVYFEAVEAAKPIPEIETARRNAGVASVEAEVALHDLGGILRSLRLPESGAPILRDIRNVAGQAAIAWHRRLAAESKAAPER